MPKKSLYLALSTVFFAATAQAADPSVEALVANRCATCHGAGGRGAKGYPRLADDVWLWGGSLNEIEQNAEQFYFANALD